jgi:hypothetical protein
MIRLTAIAVLAALVAPAGPGAGSGFDAISVDFDVLEEDGTLSVVVRITNSSDEDLSVEGPGNRYALMFLVMNEHGNVVAPEGIAKVTRVQGELVLKAGETVEHTVRAAANDKALFQYLSGTALWGYELERGAAYRVVAIYRPLGKDGEGICSREKLVTLD